MVRLLLIPILICSTQFSPNNVRKVEISFSRKNDLADFDFEDYIYSGVESNISYSNTRSSITMAHLITKTNKYYLKTFNYDESNEAKYINGKYSKTIWDIKSNNPRKNEYEKDNRININELSEDLPLSSIGYLEGRKNSRETRDSTCFLIGNGLALTAAHCVYDIELNKFYYNINAMFDRGQKRIFSTTIYPTDVYIPNQFIISKNEEYDWAILKFDEDLTNKLGCLTIASHQSLYNEYYSSIGFPFDKDEYSYYESTGFSVKKSEESYYETYSYCASGMSGGPVIGYYTEVDERDPNVELSYEYVVGINSRIVEPDDGSKSYLLTDAIKINDCIIDLCTTIGE